MRRAVVLRLEEEISTGSGILRMASNALPMPLTNERVVVKDADATLTAYPEVYFAGREPLAADEMRVIALGTGTPNFRRSQASASWLVELGDSWRW